MTVSHKQRVSIILIIALFVQKYLKLLLSNHDIFLEGVFYEKKVALPLFSLAFTLMTSSLIASLVELPRGASWQESFLGELKWEQVFLCLLIIIESLGHCTMGLCCDSCEPVFWDACGRGGDGLTKLYMKEVDYGLCPTLEIREHQSYESYEAPI